MSPEQPHLQSHLQPHSQPDAPVLPTLEAQTGPNPSASLVILHGLGASGDDFEPLAQAMDLRAAGAVRYVLPNAPSRRVTANGGYVMPAWYDILAFGGSAREDEAGLRESLAQVHALLDRERARGIDSRRIVLGGFSQGCAMALLAGLRYAHPLAGIVGLSGYLPLAATTAAERHAANAATPVFLGHGRQDGVVPLARGEAARDALQALGQPVVWHAYDAEHTLVPEEVQDLQQWLLARLAPSAPASVGPGG